jgi:ubiquinone/menaquinone biosynthesis C-methylase UbiE
MNSLNRYIKEARLIYNNARYRVNGLPDGLPIPPKQLRHLVWSEFADLRVFFSNCNQADYMLNMLSELGADIDSFMAILDFGCGCGKSIRSWYDNAKRGLKVYGSDINTEQIEWCRRNLRFAGFVVNGAEPPLEYSDSAFDFIYTVSVFTHLTANQQISWLGEMRRILRPGGFLLLTTAGESYLSEMSEEQREDFIAGRLIVLNQHAAGDPAEYGRCIAYHPKAWVSENMLDGFQLLKFIPGIVDPSGPKGELDEYWLRRVR